MGDPLEGASGSKNASIIIQSDGSSFKAGITLDETNYDLWSQIMEMHIAEKEKLSFIRGKSPILSTDDDKYEKWYADNQKVKRWLLMSMSPAIMKRYIRLATAREIWDALSKAFYDGTDELQVFVLNQRAFSAKQNGRALSVYYGELVEFFSELDHRDKVIMESANDVESYRKSVQRLRVHIFLAGLDVEFEQIRGEILRKELVPELEPCYALVRRESVRHSMMKDDLETEASAMVLRNRYPPSQHKVRSNDTHKSTSKCTHCNRTGHTKNGCFEIVGYPEWWDHNRNSSKRSSNTNTNGVAGQTSTIAAMTTHTGGTT